MTQFLVIWWPMCLFVCPPGYQLVGTQDIIPVWGPSNYRITKDVTNIIRFHFYLKWVHGLYFHSCQSGKVYWLHSGTLKSVLLATTFNRVAYPAEQLQWIIFSRMSEVSQCNFVPMNIPTPFYRVHAGTMVHPFHNLKVASLRVIFCSKVCRGQSLWCYHGVTNVFAVATFLQR